MKKSTKIVVTISVILLILIIIAIITFTFVNKSKKSITSEEFKNIMTDKGYMIGDATNQFSNYDYIKKTYIATNGDYQIEFYEIVDDTYATTFYNNNKFIFESSKGNASMENNIEINNYAKYTLSTNNKYMVVSRIDNTVIYLSVNSIYKDEVKDILKDIGY